MVAAHARPCAVRTRNHASRRAFCLELPNLSARGVLMRNSSVVVAILSVVFFACPPRPESNPAAPSAAATGEILIGEYGSLTGSEASFGQETHNAIMMAIEEANAAGGVNGR